MPGTTQLTEGTIEKSAVTSRNHNTNVTNRNSTDYIKRTTTTTTTNVDLNRRKPQ